MLTINYEKRISWNDLFSHHTFFQYGGIKEKPSNRPDTNIPVKNKLQIIILKIKKICFQILISLKKS